MTPDDLREATRAALSGRTSSEVPCPRCGGRGTVMASRPVVTQAELAAAIGTTRPSVSSFLNGRQTFGMDVTLRLIDWLAAAPQPVQEDAP